MTRQQLSATPHSSFTGRIGVSRVDITPPVGIYSRNWGAAKHDVATSIHRPLTLSALTLSPQDEEQTLVFVDADLGWWRPLSKFLSFQARVLKELSLDSSEFIFALSHTHAAPPLMDAEDALPGSDLLNSWFEQIYQATVEAVRDAQNHRFEATLDWHTGRCGLATVRDLPDPTFETNRILCGHNPDGKPDDTLLLARVTDKLGNIRAIVVNYACHPTTLAWENTAISPDYVGAMRETIEHSTGATAIFLQGASGDLAPRYQYVGDTKAADQHGRQLGYAALATLNDMEPPATLLKYDRTVESGAPLAVWQHQPRVVSSELRAFEAGVDLHLKDWPAADELELQRAECSDRALEERLRRKRDIRGALGDGDTFSLPIWAWQLGDAFLVGSCCEPYSLLQHELRRRFPELAIACVNLINGSIGYLPPAEMYDQDVYQVWQTPFAAGSLERLVDAMTVTIGTIAGTASNAN